MGYENVAVLIPAYEPDYRLNDFVESLIQNGLNRIVVVDDGSGTDYSAVFDNLKGKATVLTHPDNLGKGAALKTGIREIMKTPDTGIVTADSDGQHSPSDVAKVADALIASHNAVIMGARDKSKMPLRSKVGNTITCGILKALTGIGLSDTQTGLRGLPATSLEAFSQLSGDRYEYEISVLIKARELDIPIKELTIDTIYFDNNATSHFNTLKDSWRIYALMFRQAARFYASSGLVTLLDYVIFIVCLHLFSLSAVICQIIARVISSVFNYFINSRMVFNQRTKGSSFVRYYILAGIILVFSCVGLKFILLLPVGEIPAKIIVDVILSFLSYRIQQSIVFK